MHEVGIISSMLKTIDRVAQEEGLSHVETVVLQVGEISGVIPHYMEECWPAATYKTKFQDTKMEMEVIPGIVKCLECGEEFNGYKHNLECPVCKRLTETIPLTGRELIIKEIRGY